MAEQGRTLRARDLRAIASAVRRVKATPYSLVGDKRPFGHGRSAPPLFVPVINETDEDLEILSIVKLDREVSKHDRGISEFPYQNYVWVATTPDDDLTGTFGVLQSPVLRNCVGRALVLGVTKVRLDDTDEGRYAQPVSGDLLKMKTGDTGAPVLGVEEAGQSDTWGVVILGGGGGATAAVTWAQITEVHGSSPPWVCSGIEVIPAANGTWAAKSGGMTFTANIRSTLDAAFPGAGKPRVDTVVQVFQTAYDWRTQYICWEPAYPDLS